MRCPRSQPGPLRSGPSHVAWPVACLLAVCSQPGAADPPEPAPGVVPIASVRATDTADPGRPVVVRGRVTWVDRGRSGSGYATLQDDTAGIWLDIRLAKEAGLWGSDDVWRQVQPGMLVEAEGVRDDRSFAPQILPRSLRILSTADDIEFPRESVTTSERLFSGVEDSQWVTISGIVQGFAADGDRWLLAVAVDGRRLWVTVPHDRFVPDPLGVVDAVVAATGVATTRYTSRGQLAMPYLFVARGDNLRLVSSPPSAAFDAPLVPLERLARFQSDFDPGRRIRTRGAVSYAKDGRMFYLQSAAIGVRVETLFKESLAPGDMVEVSGFLDRSRVLAGIAQAAGIVDAVVRVVGEANRPTATVIQPGKILEANRVTQRFGRIADPGDYDGCLIECRGRVAEVRPGREAGRIMLVADDTPLTAVVSGDVLAALPRLETGCEIAVRGVVQFDLRPSSMSAPWNLPGIDRMSLLVPAAADITILSRPSWWTAGRLSAALAAAVAVLTGALGWAATLRRQVARQSRRLAAEITARERAHIEFEAALHERTRLAANLHDTVLQTVTGIGYQLKACRRARPHAEPGGSPEADRMAVAEQMVEHAVDQLRGTLWAMRSPPLEGRSFTANLESLALRLGEGQSTRIVVHVDGVERPIDEERAGSLVLVAQEAVVNALRHAAAATIDMIAVFEEASVGVVIQDDGRGFDPALRADSAGRHFGIDGMAERMRRLGGTLAVESRPGAGTTVTAVAPALPSTADSSARSTAASPGAV